MKPKQCRICMEVKPPDDFYLTATGRLSRYCKACFPVKDYMVSLHVNEINLFKRSPSWERCLEYWNHTCAICGKNWSGMLLIPDHWRPFGQHWQEGSTIATNIIPLCRSCNSRKGGKEPETYLIRQFGEIEAMQKLAQVEAYFEWVRRQSGL